MRTRLYRHEALRNRTLILSGDTDQVYNLSVYDKAAPQMLTEDLQFATAEISWLDDYFSGQNPPPYYFPQLTGTVLQQAVWQAITQIPYGQTITYTQLADKVGKPKAVRAVASACGKNPLPIYIPCHRVIAKDGSLGGYAWGLDCKRLLLGIETR